MVRNGFFHRHHYFRRRSTANADEVAAWTNWLSTLLLSHDHGIILNCDETSWRLHPNNILPWWDIGADDVLIKIQGDEKEALTVLATISAMQ
jgi:hypothetical protein